MTIAATQISLDSREGKSLLRKVAKIPSYGPRFVGWTITAHERDGWRLKFKREGNKPEVEVFETDYVLPLTGEYGDAVKPFDDSNPVIVPKARSIWCYHSQARAVATLLLGGWRLKIQHSAGSTGSSKHGIATVSLVAEHPNGGYVTIEDALYRYGDKLYGCGVD